ncbi:thiamine pyrophosphate-binding protein [Homoserinimonas sp. OAct 916]|uniref:thiamine pyrophosphate-binding protein n=1 Tax=Homoserinimonas sp. OAct 916 TaxID=2211450 RepID=UPI0018E5A09C|nr:thiamine pyrophosphate-binding protein [Homoserinimonas sp. OAct 916]
MKVHAALAHALKDLGVDTVFGLMGDGNLWLVDSFVEEQGGTYVSAAHEANAVLMANGYARISGRVGVATVTHGPALTNCVTSLTDAVRGRTPMVLIAGDTPAEARDHSQNIAQRDVVMPTGAGFEQMRSPRTAVEDLVQAFRRALAERRPIVLNVPREFNLEEIDYTGVELRFENPQVGTPDPEALDVALGIIASAKRPLILAGKGAAGAGDALTRLADQIGAPVATTLQGQSLFQGHPYDLGICGTLASDATTEIILKSDCIIAFGAALNKFTTAEGSFLEGKTLVHCDTNLAAIGHNAPVDAGIVGDARMVAETMLEWLQESEIPPSGFRTPEMQAQIAASEANEAANATSKEGTVPVRTALQRINALLPSERSFATDLGRFVIEAWRNIRVPRPHAYVHTNNFGAIGMGMGNAVGMAFGAEDAPVVLVTGDGGFMLGGIAEFNTAVRFNRDLIVVVVNDSAYGAEHIQFKNRDLDPTLTEFTWPDFAVLADALGGQGVSIRSLDDLDGLAEIVERRSGPLLIDVHVDPHGLSNSMGAGAPK